MASNTYLHTYILYTISRRVITLRRKLELPIIYHINAYNNIHNYTVEVRPNSLIGIFNIIIYISCITLNTHVMRQTSYLGGVVSMDLYTR